MVEGSSSGDGEGGWGVGTKRRRKRFFWEGLEGVVGNGSVVGAKKNGMGRRGGRDRGKGKYEPIHLSRGEAESGGLA